jgi:uracil phosphoribosyltransferase
MIVHNIGLNPSVLDVMISEIRDELIQKDTMRFRRNIERAGEILAYEMSKSLSYNETKITTQLGIAEARLPDREMVVCSVLRAGFHLYQGIINYFDKSDSAFVSAYRETHNDGNFDIKVEYLASPSLDGKILILADTMLATGKSIVSAYNALLKNGTPAKLHILSVIASKQGLDYLNTVFDDKVEVWVAAIDPALNKKSYIVPGLGDAGDLAYGEKL